MDKYTKDIRKFLIKENMEVYYKDKLYVVVKINEDWTVFIQEQFKKLETAVRFEKNPNDYKTVNINELMFTINFGEVIEEEELKRQLDAWDAKRNKKIFKNMGITN